MRMVADCLLAAWSVLNLVLAVVARRAPQVAAVFAGAAVRWRAAGLLAGSLAVVVVGLASSVIAPVLYGQRVAGQNHLTHHLVRGLVVIALAVLYWLA